MNLTSNVLIKIKIVFLVIALQYYEDTYSFYLPNELENPLEFSISALVSPHEEIQYSISEGKTNK